MHLSWKRRDRRRILLLLGLALAGSTTPGDASAGSAGRRQTEVTEAIKRAMPSVVSIASEKKAASTSRWPFSPEESTRPLVSGMGTGVIIDARGYILTNHHVVDKVQGIEVQLADGSTFPARVLDQDPVLDLAMLKIDAGRPLTPIAMGISADLMLGEDVITIGNAFGYENTISRGIISSLGRGVTLNDNQAYRNLIQTDACINPGNSGGPMLNIEGEMIGVNVATRAGAQGIGFALAVDDVKLAAAKMLSTRQLASTWHGLVARERGVGESRTLVLDEVQPGSPAEASGFRPGDQLVRVGDLAVTNPIDVERALIELPPGRRAPVVIKRAGQEQSLAIETRAVGRALTAADPNDQVWRRLGLFTAALPAASVAVYSDKLHGGLLVKSVAPNSPAARANLQKDDILVGMNSGDRHYETIRANDILYVLKLPEVSQSQLVKFYVVRQNVSHTVAISLAATSQATALNR